MVELFSATDSTELNSPSTASVEDSFLRAPICSNEVISNIEKLKTSRAMSHTDVETKFLKLAKPIIFPVLAYLINECFNKDVYLKCLKIAEAIPIFKKVIQNKFLTTAQYRFISI